MPKHLPEFYLDLGNKDLETSMCIFHQRFSTNTLPQWRLAQPFRLLAHNGEINTIRGNRNWAQARNNEFRTNKIPELHKLKPFVSMTGSDSLSLDNMLLGRIILILMTTLKRATNIIRCTWNHGMVLPGLS